MRIRPGGEGRIRRLTRFSVLGDGMLDRARSIALGLLGMTAAVCLALIAIVAQQSWPLLPGSPIPGLSSGQSGTIRNAVALPGSRRGKTSASTQGSPPRSGGGAHAVPAATRTGAGGTGGTHATSEPGSGHLVVATSHSTATGHRPSRSHSAPQSQPATGSPAPVSATTVPVEAPASTPATVPESSTPAASPASETGNRKGNGNGNGNGGGNGKGAGKVESASAGTSGTGSGGHQGPGRSGGHAAASPGKSSGAHAGASSGGGPKGTYGVPVSTGKSKGSTVAVASSSPEASETEASVEEPSRTHGQGSETHGQGNGKAYGRGQQ